MSDELGYEPRVRPVGEVKAEVAGLSSAVLDMVRVKAAITEGGPMALPWDDEEDPYRYCNITHIWSLYGVADTVLAGGMTSLADRLPDNGWTVVKNGPDTSREGNQEILAVHLATRAQLEATRRVGGDGREPQILFSVYSRFFSPTEEPF